MSACQVAGAATNCEDRPSLNGPGRVRTRCRVCGKLACDPCRVDGRCRDCAPDLSLVLGVAAW